MINKGERQQFSERIQRAAIEQKISHIEAIVNYCEQTGLEIEMVGHLVTRSLKDILEQEGLKSKGLKGQTSTMKLI